MMTPRPDLQLVHARIAACPAAKPAGDVDMAGKADILDLRLPETTEQVQAVDRHIDVVQASNQNAGKW